MPVRYAVPPFDTEAPARFVAHAYERTFEVAEPREAVWGWLNDPDTFVKGQIWPYFVEFVDGGFETGVLNTHSGPGIHFPGVIGEIRAQEYRDLVYLYGAYAIGMRWIRPTRLQFWLEDTDAGGTRVRVRLDSHVRRGIRGIWSFGSRLFWGSFGRWIRSGVAKRARLHPSNATTEAA